MGTHKILAIDHKERTDMHAMFVDKDIHGFITLITGTQKGNLYGQQMRDCQQIRQRSCKWNYYTTIIVV